MMRWPVSLLANEGGKGKRMSARRSSTCVDPGAEHGGREAAAHGLDFGQFRHGGPQLTRQKTGPAAAPANILTIVPTR